MVTEKTIKDLIQKNGKRKITITLPTEKVGDKRQQNPIRFKNLLNETLQKLTAEGMKQDDANTFLQPAKELLGQPLFWSGMEQGMVAYLTEDYFEIFKVPYDIREMTYVHDHFRITPLMPMISTNGSFCVLAVGQENPRLLRCTRTNVKDITPDDVPESLKTWVGQKPEQQVQYHTGNNEGDGAIYFGHGATEEDHKELVQGFLRDVERPVTKKMKQINDPLVLAGTEPNLPIYKKINKYSRILEDAVDRNPNGISDIQLRDMSWNVVRDYFLSEMYEYMETYREGSSDYISRDLTEVITSTVMGKSAAIFITKDLVRWGKYDEEQHKVFFNNAPANSDLDLMNWLTMKGIETGSKVYILSGEEMPDNSEVAALFRY